jgi:hypothetical protein
METKYQIIEADSIHIFTDELEYYTGVGFTAISSNSFWNFNNSRISYYALLIKNIHEHNNDDIPLTYQEVREFPNLKID